MPIASQADYGRPAGKSDRYVPFLHHSLDHQRHVQPSYLERCLENVAELTPSVRHNPDTSKSASTHLTASIIWLPESFDLSVLHNLSIRKLYF